MILAGGYDVNVRAWFVDYFLDSQKPKKIITKNATLNALIETQLRLDAQEEAVENLTHRLDAIDTAVDYFTVVGYARANNINLPLKKAAQY